MIDLVTWVFKSFITDINILKNKDESVSEILSTGTGNIVFLFRTFHVDGKTKRKNSGHCHSI